ncbi:MAG TPA: cupin domain-containing protein [Coriobacteriia bacterium]|nr:cupin domain-containing protein [Coriobacteriia bacterium]
MRLSHPPPTRHDERGEIIDILVKENIEYVTLITAAAGSTRGNHYHKETVQSVYVLEGRLRMLTRIPGEPVVATVLEKGDLATTDRMEQHAMTALEDSSFMVFTTGVRGGEDYEKDTYRLDEPLRA